MSNERRNDRWRADLKIGAKKWFARAWQAVASDPKASDEADIEAVGASELAKQAGQLKGGMAKVAQLMAYSEGPGAIDDEAARTLLGSLWDRAPARSAAEIGAVVAAELGGPPEKIFAKWNREPIAAASLGQVHAAEGPGGERYAVKVQYPGVAEALRADLTSKGFARRLAGSELGKRLDDGAIEALRDAILGELDYVAEADAIERFAAAFAGDRARGILIPSVDRTRSTARVLTMERMPGRSLGELATSGAPETRAAAARLIFRFAWGGPLRHGLLHADPNPGNYLVDGEGEATRVSFLDFGCTRILAPSVVEHERAMWSGVTSADLFAGAERFRLALQEQGLLGRAQVINSVAHRTWEKQVARPFVSDEAKGFHWNAEYAAALADATARATAAGTLVLPAAHVMLWRQRVGVAAVIATLDSRADWRALLRELLVVDDAEAW